MNKLVDIVKTCLGVICAAMVTLIAAGTLFAADGPPPYPPPDLEPGGLTEAELQVIDLALCSILLDRSDMSFKKDYVDDPFRLEAVQKSLDDPLFLVSWTYDWDAFLLDTQPLDAIIRRAADEFDDMSDTADPSRPPSFHSLEFPPEIGIEVRPIIERLDRAVAIAGQRLETRVFGVLGDESLEFIRSWLVCRFFSDQLDDYGNPECPVEETYGADPRFLEALEKIPVHDLLLIAADLTKVVEESAELLKQHTDAFQNTEPVYIQGTSGWIAIGTTDADVWVWNPDKPPVILVEPGGDDFYRGPFGAAGSLHGEQLPDVTVLIDLEGDDVYVSRERGQGSGCLGIAVVVDMDGNDIWRAGRMSQGSGVFGVGILRDDAGNDVYHADLHVQGAGFAGLGLLWNGGGDDTYRGAMYAQGFGYPKGFGLLADRDGNDSYFAGGTYHSWPTWGSYMLSCSQGFAFGMRPVASGGIGFLHDRNGNDVYNADVFSQGSSYWYGIGALVDDAGNDQFSAQVYSQGAGIHLSAGILISRGGNDNFSCDHQAQGFAHDYSVGWLINEGGNNNYSVKTNGQGCAVTNSVAVLLDREGNDAYLTWENNKGHGYGEKIRGFGNIGLQIDMQGNDVYSLDIAENGGWWTLHSWYAGIDVPESWWHIETDEETGEEISRKLVIPDDTGWRSVSCMP